MPSVMAVGRHKCIAERALRAWGVGTGFLGVDGSCAWWRRTSGLVFGLVRASKFFERDKGIRWMPWHQEAMKDVARCEKPWGAASRR